jgi:hypothetical protein
MKLGRGLDSIRSGWGPLAGFMIMVMNIPVAKMTGNFLSF